MSKEIIHQFLSRHRTTNLNIDCVGDAMVDEYYNVSVDRISPEFPMPIMLSKNDQVIRKPGGAANVVNQFKNFNVNSRLFCLNDPKAIEFFHNPQTFTDFESKLPIKKRFLDRGVQVVRHDVEYDFCDTSKEDLEKAVSNILPKYLKDSTADVTIFSDYNKGFFSYGNFKLSDLCLNTNTIVDPKKGPLSKWQGCTIFKPNSKEAFELSGLSDWKQQASFFKEKLGCQAVVITRGGDGVCGVYEKGFFEISSNEKINVESVVGAGDCFCAVFAMAFSCKFTVPESAEIAFKAGNVYVQGKMNRPIVPAELSYDKIVNPLDLRKRNFKLVFANGCFDILHEGHMSLLNFAKTKGDKLVVAVNSDKSVKSIKGEKRPVVPLSQRMAVLGNISCVDFVTYFEEADPIDLIKTIQPDVLVKGAEYETDKIKGSDLVKEVFRAPMIEGLSTTKLLNKF